MWPPVNFIEDDVATSLRFAIGFGVCESGQVDGGLEIEVAYAIRAYRCCDGVGAGCLSDLAGTKAAVIEKLSRAPTTSASEVRSIILVPMLHHLGITRNTRVSGRGECGSAERLGPSRRSRPPPRCPRPTILLLTDGRVHHPAGARRCRRLKSWRRLFVSPSRRHAGELARFTPELATEPPRVRQAHSTGALGHAAPLDRPGREMRDAWCGRAEHTDLTAQ